MKKLQVELYDGYNYDYSMDAGFEYESEAKARELAQMDLRAWILEQDFETEYENENDYEVRLVDFDDHTEEYARIELREIYA